MELMTLKDKYKFNVHSVSRYFFSIKNFPLKKNNILQYKQSNNILLLLLISLLLLTQTYVLLKKLLLGTNSARVR